MASRLLDPRSAAYMLADFSQQFEKSDVNENCKSFHSRRIFENVIYKIIWYIFKFKWNFQKDTTIAMQENAFRICL